MEALVGRQGVGFAGDTTPARAELWHCALILATGNSDSALLLGAESITSP